MINAQEAGDLNTKACSPKFLLPGSALIWFFVGHYCPSRKFAVTEFPSGGVCLSESAYRPKEEKEEMRKLSITISALIISCIGYSFYGAHGLNSTSGQAATFNAQQRADEPSAAVKAAIQKLSSPDPRERTEAACALGQAHAPAAIPALIKILGDDAPVEQPVCGQKGSWSAKGDNKISPGEMAAVALSKIGQESVEPLINALKTEGRPGRANAAFALGMVRDERSIEPLIAALQDGEWQVREKAAWSLGLTGDQRAVEYLAGALKDAEWHVRAQAAWALGLKGDDRAVDSLIAALRDENQHVQSQAAWALGLKGDERAVEPLSLALQAQGEDVRSQAAWALGLKGDARAVEPLIGALRDTNAHVRSQAAWALGLKGDKRAVEPLKVALNDADEQVRKQAAWALQMRGLQSARQ